ncbi:MAG: hypothetical protein HYW33_01015 [Candidatus Blackburnbacteria bacterium]|nr:hypothetical protein [Candidatus Blackburnbacteria bacterium]
MPYRRMVFGNGEIYHVVNRGVASMPIATSERDYKRFLTLVEYYRYDTPLSFSHYLRLNPEEQSLLIENIHLHYGKPFSFNSETN